VLTQDRSHIGRLGRVNGMLPRRHLKSPQTKASPMNRTSFAEAVMALARLASASSDALPQAPMTPDAAARQWLLFVDGGDNIKSWDRAGVPFKNAIDVQDWRASVAPVREPLGAVFERKLIDVKLSGTMAGAAGQ
jgi:hypothetical protein